MTECLTKENFWNELYAKYPEAVYRFCDWIDQYKKQVNWNHLFACKGQENGILVNYKYHDLPIAIQLGIFLQFAKETRPSYEFEFSSQLFEKSPKVIEEFFRSASREMNIQKQTSGQFFDYDDILP
jgi:hypothetical protein